MILMADWTLSEPDSYDLDSMFVITVELGYLAIFGVQIAGDREIARSRL